MPSRQHTCVLSRSTVRPLQRSTSDEESMGVPTLDEMGVVVIGRNEGGRLVECIQSVIGSLGRDIARRTVYVDSGSMDGSPELAEQLGIDVLRLDPAFNFTAARGRNEGFKWLRRRQPLLRFVQFIDGDCELVPGWCEAALLFMRGAPKAAVVCGRLRERDPDCSIYNQLYQIELDAHSGNVESCGGIALVRAQAFADAGGFCPDLAAGEEPELCIRLRENGWEIWRISTEMAVHDAAMVRFGQWWKRAVRSGAGFAQIYFIHHHSPYGICRRETARAIFWGGLLPLIIAGAGAIHPLFIGLAAVYPIQVIRIARRRGISRPLSWRYGLLMVISKFAEFLGILRVSWLQLRGRFSGLRLGRMKGV